jgi:hypothetical protein
MSIINAAQAPVKTLGDPNAAYESLKPLWMKSRAFCGGERFVKDLDAAIDTSSFTNILIPFSNTMTQAQYNFYKAEAELPGITAQFSKMIVAGLLRKQPSIKIPDDEDGIILDWIMNEFGNDDSPILSFLDEALWEEVQTKAWVLVSYPEIADPSRLDKADYFEIKPFPILYKADMIINWRKGKDKFGKTMLSQLIIRGYVERIVDNEFHPKYVDTVWVHEIVNGAYQVRVFERLDEVAQIPVVNGQQILEPERKKAHFNLVDTKVPLMNGEPIEYIPAWPLNGAIDPAEPMLQAIIDKEVALYNKMSRRNHLLYGAATYTPIISSDMSEDDFEEIVGKGLGSWIHLRQGDSATVLETPTAALADMERAIAANLEEMAKLGIRMLSPETSQSGIALELRNANQTARVSSLNNKFSGVMKQVISFMINWRFGTDYRASEIGFELSSDFSNAVFGEGWLRLATEWYQAGLIPRSIWLLLLKQNDVMPPEYDDEAGRMEITEDLEQQMAAQQQFNPASELEE